MNTNRLVRDQLAINSGSFTKKESEGRRGRIKAEQLGWDVLRIRSAGELNEKVHLASEVDGLRDLAE